MPGSQLYFGQIQGIERDTEGTIHQLYMVSESHGEYVMNLSPQTVWIDSGNHTASDPATLEIGESVYVFHSPVSTRSLPPQSAAYAVVRNIPQDAGTAKYHQVESVTEHEDGSITITTDQGGLMLSAGKDTVVSAYDGSVVSLADIHAGTPVMAWYPLVMLSYPGQAHADYLMVLPELQEGLSGQVEETGASEPQLPQEGAELSILLEGDMALPVTGRYEQGTAMVPVAAVAQALGYQVTYTPAERAEDALVTVESDQFRVELRFLQNEIIGVTKVEGAVGMTAPMDYGMAPYAVDPGVTWAPAQLFEMLGRTVTLEGTTLSIW